MTLTFRNNEQPLATKREIKLLQTLCQIKLPPVYRDFLLAHNGGIPSQRFFPAGQGYEIQLFYTLIAKASWADLASFIAMYAGRIPSSLIPIAGDSLGNQFCLAVAGQHFGQIFFWDCEGEDDEAASAEDHLTPLAPSFDAFLAQLIDLPPDRTPQPQPADDELD